MGVVGSGLKRGVQLGFARIDVSFRAINHRLWPVRWFGENVKGGSKRVLDDAPTKSGKSKRVWKSNSWPETEPTLIPLNWHQTHTRLLP